MQIHNVRFALMEKNSKALQGVDHFLVYVETENWRGPFRDTLHLPTSFPTETAFF